MIEIIAHRGAAGVAPENTLAAFRIAAEMGAHSVEFDVQLSADGVPMIYHDDSLDQCTDVRKKFPRRKDFALAAFTSTELAKLDAAHKFVEDLERPKEQRKSFLLGVRAQEQAEWLEPSVIDEYRDNQTRIPTLESALEICRDLGLNVCVELKSIPRLWPDLPDLVWREIKNQKMESRCVVSSFDHQHLARVRERDPKAVIAALTGGRLHSPSDYLRRLGAQAYNPGCYGGFDSVGLSTSTASIDIATIHELRSHGFGVNVWTVNAEPDMKRLIGAGVSGIFTDFPNRLLKVVNGLD